MNATYLRSLLSVATLAAALSSLAGCGATVVTGDGTDADGAAIKGGNGPKKNDDGNAIAILHSDLPPIDPGEGGTTSSGGGDTIDPDTIHIDISDLGMQCADPYAAMPCGSHYRVSIAIAPELQQVGTYPLSATGISGFASVTGPGTNNDCYGGGGSFMEGTIEITAIDDTHIEGVLAGTESWEFDANGPFNAVRCQF